MRRLVTLLTITLLLTGCTRTIIKGTTCPLVELPPYVSYEVNNTSTLQYYVDINDTVHGLTGTELNHYINTSYLYRGYLHNASREILLYRRKIKNINTICSRKED